MTGQFCFKTEDQIKLKMLFWIYKFPSFVHKWNLNFIMQRVHVKFLVAVQNTRQSLIVAVSTCSQRAWVKVDEGRRLKKQQKHSFWPVSPVVRQQVKALTKESCLYHCGQEAEESARIQYSSKSTLNDLSPLPSPFYTYWGIPLSTWDQAFNILEHLGSKP